MIKKRFEGKSASKFNFVASNYEFRYNTITALYEYRRLIKGKPSPKENWGNFDDRVRSSMQLELIERDLEMTDRVFNLFIESPEVSPDYDPFKEYFEHLPIWNEKTDYLQQICETIPTDNPEVFKETLKKFLIGTLDCLMEEDAVNDVCLVFQSEQGLGKTRWMRRLIPEQFRKIYFYEGSIDTGKNDDVQYLSQYWFIHLDELEVLKGNDIAAIKSYITRQRISLRKAYGRHKSHFIRRASFLGSVNDDKFLSDTTGNRRWLVFTINGLIDYDHNVFIDGLWSQIFSYWKEGYKHWFDISEIKEINARNESYRYMSSEEELLLELFKFPNEEVHHGQYMTATQIVGSIMENRSKFSGKLSTSKLGKALSKHSSKKQFKNGCQRYYVVLIDGINQDHDYAQGNLIYDKPVQ